MILNFRTTCTARSRVLHDNLTILRVVMEHVHVHMYGTTFSALVLWRILTESHRVYEPPVLFVLFRVVVELLHDSICMYCTKFNVSVLVRTLAEYRYDDAHMDGMKSSRFHTFYGPRCIYCTTYLGHKNPSRWFLTNGFAARAYSTAYK